jgi:hypothetical protein
MLGETDFYGGRYEFSVRWRFSGSGNAGKAMLTD